MQQINSQALLNLASSKIQRELAALGGAVTASTDVQAALSRLAQEQHQKDVDTAAGEILKLKGNMQEFRTSLATQNVALQAQIDANKAVAAKVTLSNTYGDTTDNYLPLQKAISGSVPTTDKALTDVPKDWVAPAAAATPAAAAV